MFDHTIQASMAFIFLPLYMLLKLFYLLLVKKSPKHKKKNLFIICSFVCYINFVIHTVSYCPLFSQISVVSYSWIFKIFSRTNAVVTPLRKATLSKYEPRIAILGIWGDTWLTRGKYGIYVAVCGNTWHYVMGPLRGPRDAFCHVNSTHLQPCLLRGGNEDTLISAA